MAEDPSSLRVLEVKKIPSRSRRLESFAKQKGVQSLLGPTGVMDPVTMLAIWRSYVPFTRDLHRQYDKVKTAVEMITRSFLEKFVERIKGSEIRRALVPAARYVIPAVSPKMFEELQWLWTKRAAEIALTEDVTPVFHLDSDWTETLYYFRELPKGKCLVHFGGG